MRQAKANGNPFQFGHCATGFSWFEILLTYKNIIFWDLFVFRTDKNPKNLIWSCTEKILTFSSELKKFLKMFSFDSNQVESALLTLYISTNKLLVQSVAYTHQKVDK